MRQAGRAWLTLLALAYWAASVPRVADAWATRFHAAGTGQATLDDLAGARAIVVLGAGIRTTFTVGSFVLAIPDAQTIYNAIEGARIYHLIPGGLPVVASGGKQDGVPDEATESGILKEWLMRAGVPEDRIISESRSRTTREQAELVMPMLQAQGWTRFVLVTPAVQGPRAAAVFRRRGGDPIPAAAPFWPQEDRVGPPGWIPTGGALRASERATYDYLAWGYYWVRGWM